MKNFVKVASVVIGAAVLLVGSVCLLVYLIRIDPWYSGWPNKSDRVSQAISRADLMHAAMFPEGTSRVLATTSSPTSPTSGDYWAGDGSPRDRTGQDVADEATP